MVLVQCTSCHCTKHAYQLWSHLNLWWQSYALDKKCSIKINQRGIIQEWNKKELWFLCTALQVFARNMHTKFGVIWTFDDKVMLWTRKFGRWRRRKVIPWCRLVRGHKNTCNCTLFLHIIYVWTYIIYYMHTHHFPCKVWWWFITVFLKLGDKEFSHFGNLDNRHHSLAHFDGLHLIRSLSCQPRCDLLQGELGHWFLGSVVRSLGRSVSLVEPIDNSIHLQLLHLVLAQPRQLNIPVLKQFSHVSSTFPFWNNSAMSAQHSRSETTQPCQLNIPVLKQLSHVSSTFPFWNNSAMSAQHSRSETT